MSSSQSKGRILICDDEGGIRDILARLVRREGYEAVEAANGMAALATVRQQAPDVLFLDVRMPGLDGIEVLRQVRQLAPHLPIVLITTSVAAAGTCGVQGYLLKPFRHEDVIRSLQQVMNERIIPHSTPE
jgi:CheY-like chemotaxis protein